MYALVQRKTSFAWIVPRGVSSTQPIPEPAFEGNSDVTGVCVWMLKVGLPAVLASEVADEDGIGKSLCRVSRTQHTSL